MPTLSHGCCMVFMVAASVLFFVRIERSVINCQVILCNNEQVDLLIQIEKGIKRLNSCSEWHEVLRNRTLLWRFVWTTSVISVISITCRHENWSQKQLSKSDWWLFKACSWDWPWAGLQPNVSHGQTRQILHGKVPDRKHYVEIDNDNLLQFIFSRRVRILNNWRILKPLKPILKWDVRLMTDKQDESVSHAHTRICVHLPKCSQTRAMCSYFLAVG